MMVLRTIAQIATTPVMTAHVTHLHGSTEKVRQYIKGTIRKRQVVAHLGPSVVGPSTLRLEPEPSEKMECLLSAAFSFVIGYQYSKVKDISTLCGKHLSPASLHKGVVGQNEAVTVVADAILRTRAGLAREHQPTGSFLFLGHVSE